MHSLSNELLSTKVIHLKDESIMKRKVAKLMRASKGILRLIAVQVRAELNQPAITDVLTSNFVTKQELVQDILFVLGNSVTNNFKTILRNV